MASGLVVLAQGVLAWLAPQPGHGRANAGVVLDGATIASPYEWTAIGDPDTIDRALEIPGGALPRIREEGGEATTTRADRVDVDAVRIPGQPEHAEPVEPDAGK